MYSVYLLSFVTQRGTRREYVGFTRSIPGRLAFQKKWPVAFARPAADNDFKVVVLEEDIESRAAALAVEALLAARAIAAAPRTARGGPWSEPRALSASQLAEVRAVGRCRSLMAVCGLGEENRGGRLWRHLRNLSFVKPPDAPAGTPVNRGACVVVRKKSGKSGPSGNVRRRRLVLGGQLEKGSWKHQQLHRGRNPTERRRVETARRQSQR